MPLPRTNDLGVSPDTRLIDLTVSQLLDILRGPGGEAVMPRSISQSKVGQRARGLNVREAAHRMGISRTTLYRRIWDKKVRAEKNGKVWVVSEDEVARVIDDGLPL